MFQKRYDHVVYIRGDCEKKTEKWQASSIAIVNQQVL